MTLYPAEPTTTQVAGRTQTLPTHPSPNLASLTLFSGAHTQDDQHKGSVHQRPCGIQEAGFRCGQEEEKI